MCTALPICRSIQGFATSGCSKVVFAGRPRKLVTLVIVHTQQYVVLNKILTMLLSSANRHHNSAPTRTQQCEYRSYTQQQLVLDILLSIVVLACLYVAFESHQTLFLVSKNSVPDMSTSMHAKCIYMAVKY